MFKGLGNIASLLKEVQNIGPRMEQVTAELKEKRLTGSAGGGMVTVYANGLGHVLKIEVDQVLIEKGDVEMVADLLPAAINDVAAKSKQLHVDSMQSIAGGFSLPTGLDEALQKFAGNLDRQREDPDLEIE
jgi:DNA-binding YbaB/EbfC family protein